MTGTIIVSAALGGIVGFVIVWYVFEYIRKNFNA